MKVVLEMPFLAFSNTDLQFGAEKLTWRIYTIVEALSITSQVKVIDKREFAKTALDKNSETFIMYVSALDIAKLLIYPSGTAQITALQ